MVHIPDYLPQSVTSNLADTLTQATFINVERQNTKVSESYKKALAQPEAFYWILHSVISVLQAKVWACKDYWPVLADWKVNDVSIQKYSSNDGISRHRDYKRDFGLVAVLTIQGRARFRAFHQADSSESWLNVITRPGSLILLRGTGILPDDEIRPYHEVGGALGSAERISLGLRCSLGEAQELY